MNYSEEGYINNILHLHSLSVDESQSYVQEIRVSLRYTFRLKGQDSYTV